MKRLAGLTAAALATLLGLALLWEFGEVIVLFVLSLAIAATLRPLVDRQVVRGWPRVVALLLVYGLALGLGFVVIWSLGPPLLEDLRQAADNSAELYDRIYLEWPEGTAFQQAVVGWLPPPQELYDAIAGSRGEAMIQGLLGVTVSLFELLSQFVIALVLSLYWSVDQARFERLWLSALPAEKRVRAREIWRAVETGVGAYIRSELAQSLLAGFLLGLGYWQLGLQYPALLALASALAWLIPWMGAILGLIPVLLVGFAAGPVVGALAGLYTVTVYVVLEFIVEPRLYRRRQYSSLLVVLVVLAMGEAFGLVGVLVAPPLAAALQILLMQLFNPNLTLVVPQPAGQPVVTLQERLTSIQAALRASPTRPSPQVVSLLERLEALLGETQALVPDAALEPRPGAGGGEADRRPPVRQGNGRPARR